MKGYLSRVALPGGIGTPLSLGMTSSLLGRTRSEEQRWKERNETPPCQVSNPLYSWEGSQPVGGPGRLVRRSDFASGFAAREYAAEQPDMIQGHGFLTTVVASTLHCTMRSMPAMPVTASKPPIVVGIKQASRAIGANVYSPSHQRQEAHLSPFRRNAASLV